MHDAQFMMTVIMMQEQQNKKKLIQMVGVEITGDYGISK